MSRINTVNIDKTALERIETIAREQGLEIMFNKGLIAIIDPKHSEEYPHYRKDVRGMSTLDIHGVCRLFNVDDSSGTTQQVVKKLLSSGTRGAKPKVKDKLEALVSYALGLQDENLIDIDGKFADGKVTITILDGVKGVLAKDEVRTGNEPKPDTVVKQ